MTRHFGRSMPRHVWSGLLLALAVFTMVSGDRAQGQTPTYDVLIRNGRIVDGTGAPWYAADLAVSGGRIAAIGRLDRAAAAEVIDAAGHVVAPGFIDMMGQTAAPFLKDPGAAFNLLTQGITTISAGEGVSDAPLGDTDAQSRGRRTMRQFFQTIEAAGLPLNVAQTVGHTRIRALVIGDTDRQATDQELARLRS